MSGCGGIGLWARHCPKARGLLHVVGPLRRANHNLQLAPPSNPAEQYRDLEGNRSDAITAHAAICGDLRKVHWISAGGVGGIYEFMVGAGDEAGSGKGALRCHQRTRIWPFLPREWSLCLLLVFVCRRRDSFRWAMYCIARLAGSAPASAAASRRRSAAVDTLSTPLPLRRSFTLTRTRPPSR